MWAITKAVLPFSHAWVHRGSGGAGEAAGPPHGSDQDARRLEVVSMSQNSQILKFSRFGHILSETKLG